MHILQNCTHTRAIFVQRFNKASYFTFAVTTHRVGNEKIRYNERLPMASTPYYNVNDDFMISRKNRRMLSLSPGLCLQGLPTVLLGFNIFSMLVHLV